MPTSKHSFAGNDKPGTVVKSNPTSLSNQSHTPGPWRVTDDHPLRSAIHIEAKVPEHEYYSEVAALYGAPNERAEYRDEIAVNDRVRMANAHLIAAAPELLAALKAYQNEMCRAASNSTRPRISVLNHVIPEAASAIAKAEGGAL